MSCPNCDQPMTTVHLDQQNILHCRNCGSSFFEENGINRISLNSARKLAADKKTNFVKGMEKLCPKDGNLFASIQNDQLIPAGVTLLRCPVCRGIFVYPDDLLRFKKAQKVKIEFFKFWSKPLPSLQTVLVFSFLAVVSLSLLASLSTLSKRRLEQSQAGELITKINFSVSGRYLFVSFRTLIPLRSAIVFEDKTLGVKTQKSVSEKPARLHYLTTGDVNLDNEVYYQIILYDDQGRKTESESKRIEIK